MLRVALIMHLLGSVQNLQPRGEGVVGRRFLGGPNFFGPLTSGGEGQEFFDL